MYLDPMFLTENEDSVSVSFPNFSQMWQNGAMSNADYLLLVNFWRVEGPPKTSSKINVWFGGSRDRRKLRRKITVGYLLEGRGTAEHLI